MKPKVECTIISIFIYFLFVGYLFRNFQFEIYILIKLKCAHFHPWYQFTVDLTKLQMLQIEYCEQHHPNQMQGKMWTEPSRNTMPRTKRSSISGLIFERFTGMLGKCAVCHEMIIYEQYRLRIYVYVYLLKWMPKMATISFSQNHKDSLSFVVQQSCNAI